jgi:ribokinase
MSSQPQQSGRVVILGIYVTDLTFRAARMPLVGETIAGSAFAMGPGGKGSNQAVAAARAGAEVVFCTRIGNDAFGSIAQATWAREGITARASVVEGVSTGAAHIFVDDTTGMNAIIVAAGAAGTLSAADVDAIEADIAGSRVFVTQLEQPLAAARRGLEVARKHGVTTVFNPAPALPLDDDIFPLCDYITPNETEAAALTGVPIANVDDARRAADVLLAKGVGTVIVTLGEGGALLHDATRSIWLPAFRCGRRLHRRLCGRSRARRRRDFRHAFRLRARGHIRHARGHGAFNADARRSEPCTERVGSTSAGFVIIRAVSGRSSAP